MRVVLLFALLGCSVWLTACPGPLVGPTVDLATIATPDPVPAAALPLVLPRLGPSANAGEWKAWVPPQVQPNGDRVEGHWIVIQQTPPAAEVIEPTPVIPRAPKTQFGAKPAVRPASPASPASPTPPPGQPGLPLAVPQPQMPQMHQAPQMPKAPPFSMPFPPQGGPMPYATP